MMARRPLIADHTHAVTLALALWGAGLYLMWDAWEGRGRRPPRLLGFITPL